MDIVATKTRLTNKYTVEESVAELLDAIADALDQMVTIDQATDLAHMLRESDKRDSLVEGVTFNTDAGVERPRHVDHTPASARHTMLAHQKADKTEAPDKSMSNKEKQDKSLIGNTGDKGAGGSAFPAGKVV